MALSLLEIQQVLKKPKNKAWLEKAEYHQSRLKFHSEEALNEKDVSSYKRDFFAKIESLLVSDKYDNFKELIQYPFPTTSIVDSIKDQYSKVFEAKDSFFEIGIKDEGKKVKFKALLSSLKEEEFWQKKAFECLFGDVNSLIVLDRPENGGNPYFYIANAESIHDISIKSDSIEYVILEEEVMEVVDGKEVKVEYYLYIDNEKYVKYKEVEGDYGKEYIFISEIPHSLGETPANFIYQENLYNSQSIVKRSAITSVLGLLDEYLIKYTSKQFLDLYNAYPIYWKYAEDTDDETTDTVIREDLMSMDGGEDLIINGSYDKMIAGLKGKKKQKLLGAGTVMEIDAPIDNTEPDLRNPIGIVSPDTSSLEYNVKEIDRLEQKIYMKATGRPEMQTIADRPINSQIQSQYEGERNVLLWVASQLSTSRTWLLNSLAKMYTGEQADCTAYFGTEYFIEDEKSVIQNLRDYKDAGASQSQIWLRNKSLMQVSTKGKKNERAKLEMLEQLEPLYNLSIDKVAELATKDLVEFKDFDLKLNFPERINKFERENGSILSYQISNPNFGERINAIKSILYSYGKTKKFNNGQGSNTGIGANVSGNAGQQP